MSTDDKETLVDRWTRYLKNQPILAVLIVVGVVLGGLASFTDSIGRLARILGPTPQKADVADCFLSGVVFDSDSNKPLSAVYIDLYHAQSGPSQRPSILKRVVATTGPDGKFSFDCKWIDSSQFPIRLGVNHPDWEQDRNTGPDIERPVRWDGINIPVPMTRVKLRPLSGVGVSYWSKESGNDRLIAGEIENWSSRSYACIMMGFQTMPDWGVIWVVVKNLGPYEKRSYETKLPGQVGFYLASKVDCSQ